MALTLYFHPLSSSCHKVLVALYDMGITFEPRFLDLGDAGQRNNFLALWPTGKMPLLLDNERVVPETSIIIEYLTQHHARPGQALLPSDPEAALETRLMDRLIDLYVMQPMQAIVGDRLRPENQRDPLGVTRARETLQMAYGLLEQGLAGRNWMAGEHFSMADCNAAPALFYAATLVPFPERHSRLCAYFERLLQRDSVKRTLDEARPYFHMYPYYESIPARFLTA
jgi:glutathione S-transferase